jgi:uncharacterized phage-associated protein
MTSVHDVASAIVEETGEVTAMKLEKLVYYCQCWHLARYKKTLFDEPIEAWRQGPVVPALYQRHRGQYHISSWPLGDSSTLNEEAWQVVRWVVASYGDFSPVQLSRMTHAEIPWRAARGALPDSAIGNDEIRPDLMANYYSRQIADSETAVTLAMASASLEGVDFDAEWEERLRDVASGAVSADQVVAEQIARLKRG